jgi:hypothetical protein
MKQDVGFLLEQGRKNPAIVNKLQEAEALAKKFGKQAQK